jgi:hypothetical protein
MHPVNVDADDRRLQATHTVQVGDQIRPVLAAIGELTTEGGVGPDQLPTKVLFPDGDFRHEAWAKFAGDVLKRLKSAVDDAAGDNERMNQNQPRDEAKESPLPCRSFPQRNKK